jgi:hypothetical protein
VHLSGADHASHTGNVLRSCCCVKLVDAAPPVAPRPLLDSSQIQADSGMTGPG